MKKLIAGMILLSAVLGYAASIPKDGKIYVNGYGGKTDVALNAVLTTVGSEARTLVISGGEWTINDDVTIPTNITLEITGDSYFTIANGEVLTLNCTLDAEPNQIFYGSGTATGTATFLWRVADWDGTNNFSIGSGLISLGSGLAEVLTNNPNAGANNATNFNLISGVTADFTTGTFDTATISGGFTIAGDLLVTNSDMAVSFMGYPKVTLTTNMLTITSNGGTPLTMSNITNALDNDLSTITGLGTGVGNHLYEFDLGVGYSGWMRIKLSGYAPAGGVTLDFSSMYDPDGLVGAGDGGYFHRGGVQASSASTNTMHVSGVINGRYIGFHIGSTDASAKYYISDMSIYGTTNDFRNMGGF